MTRDTFKIEGPALISFSGGRTSAYMLRRVLDAHGGTLPADVHVAFANTGKEREETLVFVDACAKAFGVRVTWLEMPWREPDTRGFAVTDFEHAARNGEPLTALFRKRNFLPNPVMRMCTQETKIRPMGKFMRSHGYEEWTNVVGIRADEPSRVHRIRNAKQRERWENVLPLATAGITQRDVLAFWSAQPFDLGLRSWEGNCDMCFLKGWDKLVRIARERPDLVQWWADAEAEAGQPFRKERPAYRDLLKVVDEPTLPGVFDDNHGAIIDCMCSEDSEAAND